MKTLFILLVAMVLGVPEILGYPADEAGGSMKESQHLERNDTDLEIADVREKDAYKPAHPQEKHSIFSLNTLRFWNWPMIQGFRHWITGTKTEEKLPLDHDLVKYPTKQKSASKTHLS